MPGCKCAVYGCKNNLLTTSKSDSGIKYHRFPKGNTIYFKTLRDKWTAACQRPNKLNTTHSRICSIHFAENAYERDLRNELLGLTLRRLLKESAVPTLNLPSRKLKNNNIAIQSKPLKRKRVDNRDDLQTNSNIQTHDLPRDQTVHERLSSLDQFFLDEERYNILLEKYNNLEGKFKCLKQVYRKKVKSLNDQLTYYKRKNKEVKVDRKSKVAEDLLQTIFTKNQVALLAKEKKRVNWTREEMTVALTLRYYSRKCYLYLKNELNYPLPALSSLRRWASQLSVTQGVLHDVISVMNLAGKEMSTMEKYVVLNFGEIKIKSLEEENTSTVVSHFSEILVVMARGLFSEWMQPVYIGFDTKLTNDILFDIITELHKISFNVVACVSSCENCYFELWNELGIGITNTYFKHPKADTNIYVFIDARHLLLLLRNYSLNTGFQLNNNAIINKELLKSFKQEPLIQVDFGSELKDNYIHCDNGQNQKVFSDAVTDLILKYTFGENQASAEDLRNFISDMNYWFDIFNSGAGDDLVLTNRAFGMELIKQQNHLKKIITIINGFKTTGKNDTQPFLKGMVMSIHSLKSLFKEMESIFNIEHMYTCKLNLNCLNRFLFQICRKGPDKPPSLLTAIERIRKIMLGQDPGIDMQTNNESSTRGKYLVAKVMKAAAVKPQFY